MNSYPFTLHRLDNFAEFLVLENAFFPHEINTINQIWHEEEIRNAELEGDRNSYQNEEIRKSKVIGIEPTDTTNWIFKRLTDLAHQANNHSYQFDLSGFYEPLQLAEYGESDFFDWHLDFGIGESSTRKLSITVQLSDPSTYEGGILQFRINNKVVDAAQKQGTAIIFPSFIMHRVTPITSGERKSLVGWVSGGHYK